MVKHSKLSERAMLARLNIHGWSGRKFDEDISEEINESKGADQDAGRYNKLLVKREALAGIWSVHNATRNQFKRLTVPWVYGDKTGLLSVHLFDQFTDTMRRLREDHEKEVKNFLGNYDHHKKEAKRKLNGMYRESDYPTIEWLQKSFKLYTDTFPVPDKADFRADLDEAQVIAIQQQIEEATQQALANATKNVWERVIKVVGRMKDRLEAYDPGDENTRATGTFRDSLVNNIRDLVDILPGLNVMNNPEMDRIAKRMQKELCVSEAKDLREEELTRKIVAESAASILAEVEAFI